MRSSKSRSRSKQNRPRTLGNIINRVFDSSGPEGKVRGTPQQIIEKYQHLARDAQLSNDRVAHENFMQHAEHYTRMLGEAMREMAAEQDQRRPEGGQQQQPRRDDRDDGGNGWQQSNGGNAGGAGWQGNANRAPQQGNVGQNSGPGGQSGRDDQRGDQCLGLGPGVEHVRRDGKGPPPEHPMADDLRQRAAAGAYRDGGPEPVQCGLGHRIGQDQDQPVG